MMTEQPRHQWYFQQDGVEYGPLTASSLCDLARAGRIRPDTPIRRDGMTETVPARRVRGLPVGTAQPKVAGLHPGTVAAAPASIPVGDRRHEGLGAGHLQEGFTTTPAGVPPVGRRPGEAGEGGAKHAGVSAMESPVPEVDLTPVGVSGAQADLPDIDLTPVSVPGARPSGGFRDSSLLTNWVEICLWAWIALSIIGIVSGVISHQALTDIKAGVFATQALAEAASDAVDRRDMFLAVMWLFLALTTSILVLKWIHRANYNARQLGAEGMRYSPGWSVGWYFVPIFCLWKPYQAMVEIWKAGSNPSNWQAEPTAAILRIWWFLWLLSTVVDYASLRFGWAAGERIEDLIAANAFTVASEIVGIPLTVCFIILVKRIYQMQMSHAGLRS
jgi:hypothetical protein